MTEKAIITLGSNRGEETPLFHPYHGEGRRVAIPVALRSTRMIHHQPRPLDWLVIIAITYLNSSVESTCGIHISSSGSTYFKVSRRVMGIPGSIETDYLGINPFPSPLSYRGNVPTFINTGFLFCCLAKDQFLTTNEGHGTTFLQEIKIAKQHLGLSHRRFQVFQSTTKIVLSKSSRSDYNIVSLRQIC